MRSLPTSCNVTNEKSVRNGAYHPMSLVEYGRSTGNQIRTKGNFSTDEIVRKEPKDNTLRMQAALAAYKEHEAQGIVIL